MTTVLEREREPAAIDDCLARLSEGSGSVLLLQGPAGIGKTELLGALRERVAPLGLELLSAVGGELESDFPFGVARQLFEPMLAELAAPQRRSLFSGAAGLAQPVFAIDPKAPADGGGDAVGADLTLATQHGLYWLASNRSEAGPLVIVVDDAQWADAASLSWLLYLARRLEGLPIALVVAHRGGEPGAPDALLARIAALPLSRALELAPLSERAVAELIEVRLGPTSRIALLRSSRRGAPGRLARSVLIQRGLRTLCEAPGPPTLSSSDKRRLGPVVGLVAASGEKHERCCG